MNRHDDALALARHIVLGHPLPEPSLEPALKASVTLAKIDAALSSLLEEMEDDCPSLAGYCERLSEAIRMLDRWKREELRPLIEGRS